MLNYTERIPSEFVSAARQLMECKCKYLSYDYKKYCEDNYLNEVSYYDLFEDFRKGDLK